MEGFKYGLKQLRFISDPGHGWLEVPTADVEASGYIPSQYSYTDTYRDQWNALSWTYLEEDCDVAGFVQALGVAPELVAPTVSYISYYERTDSDSWVRDLPHCSGQGFMWWRITHPGPGLSPTDPVPYVPNYPPSAVNWRA